MMVFDTVTEALTGLRQRGFLYDFDLRDNKFHCEQLNKAYDVPELILRESFRFEGDSDPGDEAIVYAIETKDGIKGVLVDGYGASSDEQTEQLLQHLNKQG
ncbi:MAG TPA: hypothetical protein VF609_14070 [Flavisolibacter sp.]|jgi:hypothetical protein